MMKLLFLSLFLFTAMLIHAQGNKPVPVIFDTDMGPDYDDVGAIALLHAFADSGKANILATIASTKYEGVAAVLNVLNTYFKRPQLPIGVASGEALTKKDFQHWTDTLIAKYPHAIKNNSDVPTAVDLYRQVLAKQPNNSVTIITVGFFTNLSALLQSQADKYSLLSGKELVGKKVKSLVSMAGRFPAGSEFNVDQDAKASKYVFENWSTPIILSGWEIGQAIKTGLPLINNNDIQNSPVKDVFRISIPLDPQDKAGRMSWDETAVLAAIAGHKPYYKLVRGTMQVAANGSNTWKNGDGNHYYLVEDRPSAEVQSLINHLMMHQPR
jgi:inosine-uridine nucleoside N-ribohydrolase